MALRFQFLPTLNSSSPSNQNQNQFCPLLKASHSSFLKFHNQISGSEVQFRRSVRFRTVRINCSSNGKDNETLPGRSVSVVLLAGGKGKRMGANMPKQYLPLLGQPIALYSFFTFSRMAEVKEIVVVCDPSYKDIFEDISEKIHVDIKFALPGKERQDSVFSGLQEIDGSSKLVCIHDSARPLVSSADIKKIGLSFWEVGTLINRELPHLLDRSGIRDLIVRVHLMVLPIIWLTMGVLAILSWFGMSCLNCRLGYMLLRDLSSALSTHFSVLMNHNYL